MEKDSLKTFKLRHTDAREAVLAVFMGESFAMSHGYIEAQLVDKYDRVTIYRTLKTFVDKGLIHKVLDDQGTLKYALCKETCNATSHNHNHDHVHFKCNKCGQTTCLDDVHIPSLALPVGYSKTEMNLLVQGVCNACN